MVLATKEIMGTIDQFNDYNAVQGQEDITNPFIADTLSAKNRRCMGDLLHRRR